MEIKEIESEVREQEEDSADIALEVQNHQQHAERLEAAVHALLEAQQSVDSDGVRHAIDHAAQARHATIYRLDELRDLKREMMQRNQELQDRCTRGAEKLQQAHEKMPNLAWGETVSIPPGDPGFSFYGTMDAIVRDGIQRLATSLHDLKAILKRLEELPI